MRIFFLFTIAFALLFTSFSCRLFNTKAEIVGLPYTLSHQEMTAMDSLYFQIDIQNTVFIPDDPSNGDLVELNTAMSTFLDETMVRFWSTDTVGARKMIQETGASGYFILMNRYEVMDTTNALISVKFETYSYALGAHGFTAITTFNFDLINNRMLKLDDLVDVSVPDKMIELENLLAKHLENPDSCFFTKPTVGNDFTRFAIDPGHVVFYFEAYELGPYSCGTATIKVPIEELKTAGLYAWEKE
ncbi:MAG: DUF3298 domain-containing protein [Bacteroidales bacterium]|nr:DUF3298 domain-containing protein [Bacteroidales bacterium]